MYFKRRISTILVMLLPVIIYPQNNTLAKELLRNEYENKKDSLKRLYGHGKILTPEFELPALIALSFYPALDSSIIETKRRRINTLGHVRPRIGFVFKNRKNRHYIIVINKFPEKNLGFGFNEIPFNAQVGFFGHELAHITDYEEKSNVRMTLFGIKYLLNKRKVERYTDITTIEHGLGQQLYSLNKFIRNNPDINRKYLEYKKKYYLNPGEIMDIMLNFNKN